MEFLQLAFLVNLILVTVLISNGQELSSGADSGFDGIQQVPGGLPSPGSIPLADAQERLDPYQQQRYASQRQYQQRGEHDGGEGEEPPLDPDDDSPPPYVLSYVYLKHLAGVEEKLYPLMTEYAQNLEKRLKIIRNYLKDYEDSSMRGTAHIKNTPENPQAKATTIAAHPLMAYRVVRRFSNEMKALEREFEHGYEREFTGRLTKLEGRHKWPGIYEHEQAMAGVLRVHYIYDMDIKQFTSGIIGGVDTGVGLTAKQTFHIAKFATYTNYYTLAMAWLGATSWKLRNATNCDDCKEIAANTLAMAYRNNIEKHNEELEQGANSTNMYMYTERIDSDQLPETIRNMHLSSLKQQNFSLDEVDVNAVRNYANPAGDLEGHESAETEEEEEVIDPEDEEAVERYNAILELRSHFNYISLCNGESTQTEAEKAKLYCWYERKKHPYWYINPLKMELLNPEPYLVQMYEFVSDKWINYLIKKATPISNAPPPPTPEATPRSAAYAWLRDEDIDEIPLSLRIEHITGLHVRGQEASTDLQIASYVSGGHVANHVDSLGEGNDPRGDRVTTFLIYLNEVERGGYTAYPLLGTFVKPVKGSAILWYDSLKNGQIDNRMLHGACPPILGSKWIATKWTHLNENFLTRPCDLDPDV